MAASTFPFKDTLYAGRIKFGNKMFDDDIIGALLHDGRGPLTYTDLKTLAQQEGFSFWGTDGIKANNGNLGALTAEEKDDAFIMLNHRLQGNPMVVNDIFVTFLDFAIMLFEKNIFKRKAGYSIVQKAIKKRDQERGKQDIMEKAKQASLALVENPEFVAALSSSTQSLQTALSFVPEGLPPFVSHVEEVVTMAVESGANLTKPKCPKSLGLSKATKKISPRAKELGLSSSGSQASPQPVGVDCVGAQDVSDSSGVKIQVTPLMKCRESLRKSKESNLTLMKENDRLSRAVAEDWRAWDRKLDEKLKPIYKKLDTLPKVVEEVVTNVVQSLQLLPKVEHISDMVVTLLDSGPDAETSVGNSGNKSLRNNGGIDSGSLVNEDGSGNEVGSVKSGVAEESEDVLEVFVDSRDMLDCEDLPEDLGANLGVGLGVGHLHPGGESDLGVISEKSEVTRTSEEILGRMLPGGESELGVNAEKTEVARTSEEILPEKNFRNSRLFQYPSWTSYKCPCSFGRGL